MDNKAEGSHAENSEKIQTTFYSPSWVDRLTRWVDGLRLPSWAFYLVIWLILFVAITLMHWQDGSYPVGVFYPFHLVLTATVPYTLALIHYLDIVAEGALVRFRPALDVTDVEYAQLRYQLTTLPPRQTILSSLVGVGLAALALVLAPESWSRPAAFVASDLSMGFSVVLTDLMWWTVGAFAYHTLHQLRLVSHIFASHTRINLFKQLPLYAFSGLSARTAFGLAFAVTMWFAVLPNTFDRVGNVISAIVVNVMAGVIFLWPLMGVHRLLTDEKARLLAETSQRLEAATADLYAHMDGGQLEGIEELVKGMEGLEINHKAVNRISTWPWAPETARGLIAALLFPLILYVGQWILRRLLEV